MAYLTITNLSSTEAQSASLATYIASEVTAGNTDGIKTNVTRNGVNTAGTPEVPAESMVLAQRSWKDSASANAYINFIVTLGITTNYSAVVNPL